MRANNVIKMSKRRWRSINAFNIYYILPFLVRIWNTRCGYDNHRFESSNIVVVTIFVFFFSHWFDWCHRIRIIVSGHVPMMIVTGRRQLVNRGFVSTPQSSSLAIAMNVMGQSVVWIRRYEEMIKKNKENSSTAKHTQTRCGSFGRQFLIWWSHISSMNRIGYNTFWCVTRWWSFTKFVSHLAVSSQT